MTLQIGDNTLDVEPEATGAVSRTRTCNSDVSKDLFRTMARTTACSSWVFYGLLAWASLNVHPPLKAANAAIFTSAKGGS